MNFVNKVRKEKLLSIALLLVTLSAGILIGTFVNLRVRAEKTQVAPDAKPLVIPDPVRLSSSFSQLAKQMEPAVVNITSDYLPKESRDNRNRRRSGPLDEDEPDSDPFRRFFGFGPFDDAPQMSPRAHGTGSGVIVDPNGYIITNHHVVEKADRIKVRLNGDTKEYPAKLIGADQETDLAVIKIDVPHKLHAAKIGNSNAVEVGDWVIAIGSPFGLEATVTAGIISAKNRDIPGAPQFQHFLQTDAAINPGNSGGPLLNIRGEVIGINTAIATANGAYAGVGFALPINTAVKVYNEIIKTGRITRGSIGIYLQKAKPELMKVYGVAEGAFVQGVEPDSPAEKAGLKEGDFVVAFNGKPIRDSEALVNAITDSPVGSQITLGVVREGKRKDIQVTVGDRARVFANNPRVGSNQPEETERDNTSGAKFGFYYQDLTAGTRDRLDYDGPSGVLVTRVDSGSFAEDLGILPNDIIVEINRQPVRSGDDLRRIQAGIKPGDPVAIKLMRVDPLSRRSRSPRWSSVYLADTLPANE